jgi:hypothetical protein
MERNQVNGEHEVLREAMTKVNHVLADRIRKTIAKDRMKTGLGSSKLKQ